MPLNLVFCGTPLFALPTLEKLVEYGLARLAADGKQPSLSRTVPKAVASNESPHP